MASKKGLTILVALFYCISSTYSQTISGVINVYTAVTAVDLADITCASVAGFAVGDRVVIIQMKGATIDETDSPAFGDVLAYNSAGYYEFGTIISISGLTITVENPLCRTYDIAAAVQLIRVPVYDNVTIVGDVTATDWNGVTGGVVVLSLIHI